MSRRSKTRQQLVQEVNALRQQLKNATDAQALQRDLLTAELAQAHEQTLRIGVRIQQMLLLNETPQEVPGFQVAARTIPSQQIDGDFYDFFRYENECLDVIIADVMGKGIPAALLGAAAKSHIIEALCHLLSIAEHGQLPEPRDIVTLAHVAMVRQLIALESFVTLAYARVDLRRHRLDFVDCGHTGSIYWRARTDQCEILHGINLPLGIREGEIYDQISVPFEPGDLFFLYSDGLTEARNRAGELFGIDRLINCIQINGALDPQVLVETIRKVVFTFAASVALSDDLTCIAIKAVDRQVPLAQAALEISSDLAELRQARAFVRTFCHQVPPGAALNADDVAALELAVNEALSNIIKHAYYGRTDQRIYLTAETFPGTVIIRMHHLGDPFDPATIHVPAFDGSQESGFGVYLITRSVDDVRYARDERGRNCITLVKIGRP